MNVSSPDIPTSFDPAIHLHSEADFVPELSSDALASLSHSDDLEGLRLCIEDDRARISAEGIVIHHRAWRTADAFRSEDDHEIDTPLKHLERSTSLFFDLETFTSSHLPSSPLPTVMPLISSPVTYPASSLPVAQSPKKRKRSDTDRSPLKSTHANQQTKRLGGFLDDSDDDDDVDALKDYQLKRRALFGLRDLAPAPESLQDYTPPASQGELADPVNVPVAALDDYFQSPSPTKQPIVVSNIPASYQPSTVATIKTASGKSFQVNKKTVHESVSFERLVAGRSTTIEGRAQKSYYGINIHSLLDEAKALEDQRKLQEQAKELVVQPSVEQTAPTEKSNKSIRTLMWTEKYRAKKFTDLVGDERTHRSVLRWLKGWDPIVFPGVGKAKPRKGKMDDNEEQRHRKILLLTGPPGLGKTTLAHVCARQAGYEVQEINASDERSRDVVKGRIRDMVGTENVRGITTSTGSGKVRKAGKPVCVVVDEVDGVVSGSGGGGEGGFIKALIDLINLDERNSRAVGQQTTTTKKRKGDKFRLLRPLILVCNDVYHPSLRPLRQSSYAEIVHIRKPALNMVVSRIHEVFGKEGIAADSDGVRRLCEATWGVSTKKEGGSGSGTGEGDIRGVMVVSEWVAGRLRASATSSSEAPRLTRRWVEDNIISDLGHGGGAARSLGRGGAKDVVDRVFREGAGFPKQAETAPAKSGKQGVIGVAEAAKRRAMIRLREMIDTSGDSDRIVSDCFTAYPEKPFQDDTLLSKPDAAYEWLYFHDQLSSQVHGSQEWELAPYLSQSVLAFHNLFASPRHQSSNPLSDPEAQPSAFSGPGASYAASEARKASRSQLTALHSTLSLPLTRLFRSPEELAIELLPYVLRMLSPDVKPVIVNTGPAGSKSMATASVRKASEKALVKKAVEAMAATGVRFEKSRVEIDDIANRSGGWVFRMEPPLDGLATFDTLSGKKEEKVRFAVRSVLESEWKRESARIDAEARKRRGGQLDGDVDAEEDAAGLNDGKAVDSALKVKVKRDFFGRILKEVPMKEGEKRPKEEENKSGDVGRIWVSFHEGFSNAVRKPITLDELMRGL